jgi:hypothetical protein
MGNEVTRLHADDFSDFGRKLEEKREALARDADAGRSRFTEGLSGMIDFLQKELLRRERIIRDGVTIPARLPDAVSISTVIDTSHIVRRSLFVKATDGSLWLMIDQQQGGEWRRIKALPSAADELDDEPLQ